MAFTISGACPSGRRPSRNPEIKNSGQVQVSDNPFLDLTCRTSTATQPSMFLRSTALNPRRISFVLDDGDRWVGCPAVATLPHCRYGGLLLPDRKLVSQRYLHRGSEVSLHTQRHLKTYGDTFDCRRGATRRDLWLHARCGPSSGLCRRTPEVNIHYSDRCRDLASS